MIFLWIMRSRVIHNFPNCRTFLFWNLHITSLSIFLFSQLFSCYLKMFLLRKYDFSLIIPECAVLFTRMYSRELICAFKCKMHYLVYKLRDYSRASSRKTGDSPNGLWARSRVFQPATSEFAECETKGNEAENIRKQYILYYRATERGCGALPPRYINIIPPRRHAAPERAMTYCMRVRACFSLPNVRPAELARLLVFHCSTVKKVTRNHPRVKR